MSEENSSNENTSEEPKRRSGKLSVIILFASIAGFAFALSMVVKKGAEIQTRGTEEVSSSLKKNKEYMVYIRKVEVNPKAATGEAWDVGGSAPDLFYKVWWKSNLLYESDVKKDSLIAEWIPVGLDLKDSLLKGSVSVDQLVKLPIVRWSDAKGAEKVVFDILDQDLAQNDKIETLTFYFKDLEEGPNFFSFIDKKDHGLISVRVDFLDNALSQGRKIELLRSGK